MWSVSVILFPVILVKLSVMLYATLNCVQKIEEDERERERKKKGKFAPKIMKCNTWIISCVCRFDVNVRFFRMYITVNTWTLCFTVSRAFSWDILCTRVMRICHSTTFPCCFLSFSMDDDLVRKGSKWHIFYETLSLTYEIISRRYRDRRYLVRA